MHWIYCTSMSLALWKAYQYQEFRNSVVVDFALIFFSICTQNILFICSLFFQLHYGMFSKGVTGFWFYAVSQLHLCLKISHLWNGCTYISWSINIFLTDKETFQGHRCSSRCEIYWSYLYDPSLSGQCIWCNPLHCTWTECCKNHSFSFMPPYVCNLPQKRSHISMHVVKNDQANCSVLLAN